MAPKKQTLNLVLLITVIANLLIYTADAKAGTANYKIVGNPLVKGHTSSASTETNPQVIARILVSTVVFHWDREKTHGSPHESLGTKINAHTVLTHNHFSDLAGTHILDLADPDRSHGVSTKTESSAIGDQSEFGAQTRLVNSAVCFEGPYAPIASRRTIKTLRAGNRVEVVFWEDARGEVAVVTLTIQEVLDGGVIELSDPADIINVGDSGGGVFFQGELIGNTWRIIRRSNQQGELIAKIVQIHLVPTAVYKMVAGDLEP